MIRHAAAVAFVLALSTQPLYAQSTVITVNTTSADVYKSPSTGSPVIGHVQRGTPLEVTRELGSWVKVTWPEAVDGIGYLHVTAGSVTHPASGPTAASMTMPGHPEPRLSSPQPSSLKGSSAAAQEQPTFTRPVFVTPATHLIGLGGRMGGAALGYGGSARGWQLGRLGIQFEISRYDLTDATSSGRVTSMQFEPGVLYSLPNTVTDYLWLRPYVGSGLNFNRQKWSSTTLGAAPSVSDTTTGFRVFGGSEMTFASVPQIAVSAELGYLKSSTAFQGADAGGLGLAIAAHWYVK